LGAWRAQWASVGRRLSSGEAACGRPVSIRRVCRKRVGRAWRAAICRRQWSFVSHFQALSLAQGLLEGSPRGLRARQCTADCILHCAHFALHTACCILQTVYCRARSAQCSQQCLVRGTGLPAGVCALALRVGLVCAAAQWRPLIAERRLQ